MNFDKYLADNKQTIIKCRKFLDDLDKTYFDHNIVNETELNDGTVSIVMTTHKREIQTFYTLDGIQASTYKNVQVIIIDDSPKPIEIAKFQKYKYQIDYLFVKNKFWVNSCINYNLGFKFVKGNKVIIQNAEVCYFGDVVNYVANNLNNKEYLVFDVLRLASMAENNIMYAHKVVEWQYILNLQKKYSRLPIFWYQHHKVRNACYHFLTAITKTDLISMNGFDIDFCLNPSYDDNEFIFRIINVCKLKVVNVICDIKVLGIHQWHTSAFGTNIQFNKMLYDRKTNEFKKTGKYITYH